MNPKWEITQRKKSVIGCWNGDCWKAWLQLRSTLEGYSMEVVDTDHGVGIIKKGKQNLISIPTVYTDLNYDYLNSDRANLLNLIDIKEFYNRYD